MLYGVIGLCALVAIGFLPGRSAPAAAPADTMLTVRVDDVDVPMSTSQMAKLWEKCRIVDQATSEARQDLNTDVIWQHRLDAQDRLRRVNALWGEDGDKICHAISVYKVEH